MQKIIFTCLFLFLLVFFAVNAFHYFDYDYGWHLKIGEEIIQKKELPHIESKLYTLEGERWVDHEWLANAFIYIIHSRFGYVIVGIFFVALTLAVFLPLLKIAGFYSQDKTVPFWAVIIFFMLGAFGIAPHSGVRIQEVTVLFLALLIWLLFCYEKNRNYGLLILLMPFFWLWASLHGGFMIGFFVLFIFAAVKTAGLYFSSNKKIKAMFAHKGFKEIVIFSGFVLLAFFATFFTLYGFELYSFLSTYGNTYYLKHINEWLPAFNYPIFYHQLLYNTIAASFLILLFIDIYWKRNKFPLNHWHLALVVIFFFLAIKSRRHFPLFFVISAPFFIHYSAHVLAVPPKLKIYFHNRVVYSYLIAFFIILILAIGSRVNLPFKPFENALFCESLPCSAVEFMKNDPQTKDKKIFNNYGWGGFMVWVWPEKQLFMDGRLPMYPYKGHTLLEEYGAFFDEDNNESKLNEYGIELVHLRKRYPIRFNWFERFFLGFSEEEANAKVFYLKEYLFESDAWDMIYEDKLSYVFIRNGNY